MLSVLFVTVVFFEMLNTLHGKGGKLNSAKVKHESRVSESSNFVTVGRNVWNCHELNACDDKLGLEAILLLHQRLDDDANGNIDISESDDFLRDELKYSNSYERQKGFHRNDKHITADELWLSWKISEVHNWTVQETMNWLVSNVELPQYTRNFLDNSVDGTALPRMAVNSLHFLSNLGIKDAIHKQKISLKAMDIVLFGPSKNHNYVKDGVLILSLIIAICGCWFAYIQHKKAQSHLKKTMKDMDNLQHAEESLRELQKELDEARQQQELAASEKKNLERQLRNEIEAVKHQHDNESSGESKIQALEQELRLIIEDLRSAEKTLEENCWVASPALQQWLQLTYEMELQHYNSKKVAAEHQLESAKEGCEKLRKKRSSFLGTFRVAHGSSIDDVDNRISQAKAALSEVTKDLQERLNRWKQIELLCGFPVVHNPGIRHLKSLLGNSAISNIFSSKACGVESHVSQTSNTGTLDDDDSVCSFPAGISARSLANIPHSISQRSGINFTAVEQIGLHSAKKISSTDLKACASSSAILQRTDAVYSEHSDSPSTDCESFEDKNIYSGKGASDLSKTIFTIGESGKDSVVKPVLSSGLKHRKLSKPSK